MTPQYKAARDELAKEYGDTFTVRDPSESDVIHRMLCETTASHFRNGADFGYAQAQAETTLLEQELIARKLEIERLAHANRAAEYERDEWKQQAENLAKALKSLDDVFEEGHTVIAAEALREYAAWKGEE